MDVESLIASASATRTGTLVNTYEIDKIAEKLTLECDIGMRTHSLQAKDRAANCVHVDA